MKNEIRNFAACIENAYRSSGEERHAWFDAAEEITEHICSKCVSRWNAQKYLETIAEKAYKNA